MSIINYIAIFNGVDLQTVPGLTILATNPYLPPKRKLSLYPLARVDGNKLGGAFFTDKDITVTACIQRASRAETEQALDTLLTLLIGTEKTLVLSQGANVRGYTCTFAGPPIFKRSGGKYLEFDLIFTCSDVFGYDTAYTTILNTTGFTSATKSDQYNFVGSAPWQCPVFVVTIRAVTGGTSAALSVGNASTGQKIEVVRTWAVNDQLIIDTSGPSPSVKVNGADVDFSGAFPQFQPGLGTINYSDGFTTRTIDYFIYYYKRYQ